MVQSRLLLHDILGELAGDTAHVYFQPPTNTEIVYPAIIYTRDFANTQFADNNPYRRTKRYMVTVIDKNPDSVIPDKVADLPMCLFERKYTANQLNHDVFNLYF